MSSSSVEFCTEDQGLDYVFAKMSAIYGAAFVRHWDGCDTALVRDTWKEMLGRFLTYRPSMDYALQHMDGDFPPSALAFRELCQKGPAVPRPGQKAIAHEPEPSKPVDPAARRRAIESLKALRSSLGITKKFEAEE